MSFGTEIAKARLDKGWKQNDLRQALGLTKQQMSLLENGKRDPRLSLVRQIARVLGVPIAQLVKEEKA